MPKKTVLNCLLVVCFLSLGSFINETCAQERAKRTYTRPKDQPKRATRREAAPSSEKSVQGVTIKGNSVQLKKGYKFVQPNPDEVSVQHIATKNVAGTFQCTCLSGDGRCNPKVKGVGMKCVAKDSCRNNCQIKISYPSTLDPVSR